MTELEKVINLLKTLEVDFSVTRSQPGDEDSTPQFLQCKDQLGRGKAIRKMICWEFTDDGKFVGEHRNGVLIGRRFAEIFSGGSDSD